MKMNSIVLEGLGTMPESELAILRSRMTHAYTEFSQRTGVNDLALMAFRRKRDGNPQGSMQNTEASPRASTELKVSFQARPPAHCFDRVCLNQDTRDQLLTALSTLQNENKLFDEWGLSEIQQYPRAAVLLSGPPGTGKTIVAHGLASRLGRPILCATSAELESKYLGDGPKLVSNFFQAARDQNAVAFIDEADTLLARRMSVTQGSERAANSMTSQLLIELEQHRGFVVFATNLSNNIDPAFDTRVITIQVPLPDRELRHKIWQRHLPAKLPVRDLDMDALADIEGICGRDVRNAVLHAASRAALMGANCVTGADLKQAIQAIAKNGLPRAMDDLKAQVKLRVSEHRCDANDI